MPHCSKHQTDLSAGGAAGRGDRTLGFSGSDEKCFKFELVEPFKAVDGLIQTFVLKTETGSDSKEIDKNWCKREIVDRH